MARRAAGEEWAHVVQERQVMHGQWRIKCSHCTRIFNGGADRVRGHFGALSGHGRKCAKMLEPQDSWSEGLRAAVDSCAAIQARKDAEAARVREAAAVAESQRAARTAAEAARQVTLHAYRDSAGNMAARRPRDNSDVDDAWCCWFAAQAIPLVAADVRPSPSLSLKALLAALRALLLLC